MMAWSLSLYAALAFGSGAVALAVGLVALRRRPDAMAWPLAALMFAVVAWTVPHGISLAVSDPEAAALWHRLRFPGITVAPVAYLVVALRYAGYEQWLTRRTYVALAVVPAVSTVLAWTNPAHGLYWQSLSVTTVGGATAFVETVGPWRAVSLAYLYGVTAAGLLVFGAVALRSDPIYRLQAGAIFLGGVIPLAANVVNTFGIGPASGVDFTAMALSVTGLTFALALFHFDLLRIRPIARDLLLDELDDGVVVIGPDGRIRDYNPTAEAILDGVALDQPAEDVLPADVAPDGGTIVAETEIGERQYRTRSTPLTDGRGRTVGRIVYMSDVTELVEREQRITVLNRILRHNVRNELNVAAGHLEGVLDDGAEGERPALRTARDSVTRVIEFAEKARHVERTLHRSDATATVSATAVAERVVAEARASYDEATIELASPDGDATARVADSELFELALTELVENAVVHNDRATPTVVVTVTADPETVRVAVADDGPGIPEHETEVLTTGSESGLEHGSGLGLWLVAWTAGLSGGELSFAENEPRGTVATLALHAVDG